MAELSHDVGTAQARNSRPTEMAATFDEAHSSYSKAVFRKKYSYSSKMLGKWMMSFFMILPFVLTSLQIASALSNEEKTDLR